MMVNQFFMEEVCQNMEVKEYSFSGPSSMFEKKKNLFMVFDKTLKTWDTEVIIIIMNPILKINFFLWFEPFVCIVNRLSCCFQNQLFIVQELFFCSVTLILSKNFNSENFRFFFSIFTTFIIQTQLNKQLSI